MERDSNVTKWFMICMLHTLILQEYNACFPWYINRTVLVLQNFEASSSRFALRSSLTFSMPLCSRLSCVVVSLSFKDFLYFSDWSELYVYFVHTWNINKTYLGHFDSWHEESTSKTGHQRSLNGFSFTLRSQLPNLLMAAPKNRMSKWRNSGLQWQRGDNETVTIVILTGTPLKQKEWHGSPDVWIFLSGEAEDAEEKSNLFDMKIIQNEKTWNFPKFKAIRWHLWMWLFQRCGRLVGWLLPQVWLLTFARQGLIDKTIEQSRQFFALPKHVKDTKNQLNQAHPGA